MIKFIFVALFVFIGCPDYLHYTALPDLADAAVLSTQSDSSDAKLAAAYKHRSSNFQIEGQGTVVKVLPDDIDGTRHQKFIVRLNSGQTVMIAHNIDVASRVLALNKNDFIRFCGQYEWNKRGGVIHWTHIDPRGSHVAGWIEHKGKIYQ